MDITWYYQTQDEDRREIWYTSIPQRFLEIRYDDIWGAMNVCPIIFDGNLRDQDKD